MSSYMNNNFDPKKHTRYKPRNPEKYKGDPDKIVSRSGYETRFFSWLDKTNDVVLWTSEPFSIPYQDPHCPGKKRRYFPDVLFKTSDGKVYLVEVKPSKECGPPRKSRGKKRQTYLNEKKTWDKNHAKWKAAKKLCNMKGWKFIFVTEKDLF